jgi:S1-C subfamily serine protease
MRKNMMIDFIYYFDSDGMSNPANLCDKPILPADIIKAVNDQKCLTFSDAVKAIRSIPVGSAVKLLIER